MVDGANALVFSVKGGNTIIHFVEKGSGEPLLLIHGLGNTIELWDY